MDTRRKLGTAELCTLQNQTTHIDIAGKVCGGISTVLNKTQSLLASETSSTTTHHYTRLRNESERFALWVDSFSATSGRLDDILRRSKELQATVTTLLYDLSRAIYDGLTESRLQISLGRSLIDDLTELHSLFEKLPYPLGASVKPGDESLLDSDEEPPDLDEVLDDLEFYIDALLDLSPALDNPLSDLHVDDSLSLPTEAHAHIVEHRQETGLAPLSLDMEDNNKDANTNANNSLPSKSVIQQIFDRGLSFFGINPPASSQNLNADLQSDNRQEPPVQRRPFPRKTPNTTQSYKWKTKAASRVPVRARTFPSPPSGWVEVTISAYNLEWSDLRNWLLDHFKNDQANFNKLILHDDCYHLWVPRYFTEAEHGEIDDLRARENETRIASYEPRPSSPDDDFDI